MARRSVRFVRSKHTHALSEEVMPRAKPNKSGMPAAYIKPVTLSQETRTDLLDILGLDEDTSEAMAAIREVKAILEEYPLNEKFFDMAPRPAARFAELASFRVAAEKMSRQLDELSSAAERDFIHGGRSDGRILDRPHEEMDETEVGMAVETFMQETLTKTDLLERMKRDLEELILELTEVERVLKARESRHAPTKFAKRNAKAKLAKVFETYFHPATEPKELAALRDEFVNTALNAAEITAQS